MFIILCTNGHQALAREKLQFKLGDKISVFAKKAIRQDEGRIFEAIGNTVILHGDETLYGHAARFDMENMLFEINGNVRYLTKDMTLYGTYLNYNTKTRLLTVENARLFTPQYRIVARKIDKVSETDYKAYQAEFTTCKDCTESWTIYGEEVDITTKQYVRVKSALMRIKGVDAFYLPYVVFPIKQDRESGLLFPSIKSRNSVGLAVAQPWFWAINQSSDATITPTLWSERGLGGDLEYRKAFNDRSYYQFESRYIKDDLFVNSQGQEIDRFVIDSEFNYQWGYGNNSYLKILDFGDLDFSADHPEFIQDRIIQTEQGAQGFYNYRGESFDTGIEFSSPKTILNDDPLYYQDFFDHRDNSVSTLPRFHYASTPYKIYKADRNFFNLLYIGASFDVNQFQQNHFNEPDLIANNSFIRNATRMNVVPYINLNLYDDGVFSLKSLYEVDAQYYTFRRESERDFKKYSGQLKTTFSFGAERIYGLAYREKIQLEERKEEEVENLTTMGSIPEFSIKKAEQVEEKIFKSYKHSQEYNLVHSVTLGEKASGSEKFRDQINQIEGWFDYYDSIRSQESFLGGKETRTQIPVLNTLEFQWNNSLTQKTPRSDVSLADGNFLKDNFSYRRTAWANLSQGVELKNRIKDEEYQLTRLALDMGIAFSREFMFDIDEYYFHDEKAHLTKLSLKNDFGFLKILNNFTYNEISDVKVYTWGFDIALTEEIIFLVKENRDLEANEITARNYAINYIPSNDCWMISLGYNQVGEREDFSFDFALNFGNPNFFSKIARIF